MNGDRSTVTGRVVDSTGAPVAGASVTISGSRQPLNDIAALTGPDGRFRFRGLPAGDYSLHVFGGGKGTGGAAFNVIAGEVATVEIQLGH